MINISYLQNWLTEIFKPCAIVYSSNLARKAINKNNLTPADFLLPFGDFKGKKIDLSFQEKTNTSANTTIRNFFFDFYDNNKCITVHRNKIQSYLTVMFQSIPPEWNLNSPVVTKTNQDPFINIIDSYSSPWYKEYEELFFECQKFDEYELFQQPLLNICFCLINEDPNIINQIKSGIHTPNIIKSGIYENPKDDLIIVINDMSDAEIKLSEDEIQNHKNKFKNEFKTNIFFWDINKNKKKPDESEQMFQYEIGKNSEYWKRYIHKTDLYNPDNDSYRNKNIKFGGLIAQSDIKIYKEDFQNFFIQTFLKKIVTLVQNYSEIAKKHKSNKITAIFKMNKKEDIIYHPNTYVYKFNEQERSSFNLGLLYFFFHNYDLAYDTLKILYTIIKQKAPQHKEKLKILISTIKFISYYNRKENNFNEEMTLKASLPELLIKKEIILIKMLEHNRNFPLLITKIKEFISLTKSQFKQTTNVSPLDFFFPLLYEKIGIYYIYEDKFRYFLYYMVFSGKYFNKLGMVTKPYSLFCYSNLLKFLDEPSYSFINSRKKITKKMSKICNNINYYEGGYKFSKNCLEFSVLYDEIKNMKKDEEIREGDEQSYYIGVFLNMLYKIENNKELRNKIDITQLDIPQIDNGSLLIVEENDYNIKKISENIHYDKKPWTIFNHYKKSYFHNPYANLDNTDLLRIKLLNDLIQSKKTISNFYSRRQFYGNINQKLYVKFHIKNPLLVILQISSIKLFCDFIPEKEEKETDNKLNEDKSNNNKNTENNNNNLTNNNDCLCLSEGKCNLQPMEELEMELSISSSLPGKIIVKGLYLILFRDSKIIHLFNKKNKNKLYNHKHKSASTDPNISGTGAKRKISTDSANEQNTKTKPSSEIDSISHMLTMQIKQKNAGAHISKKTKVEYIVKDYNNDVYLDFPLGLDIDIYLYQLIFFPIIINNTSTKQRIRRFSIFLESSDDRKIKTFYNYITKDIELNIDNQKSQKILIPLLPISTDYKNLYVKVLVKCADEMRIYPIEVKRFIIKLNIKNSFSFEFKESYNNLNSFDKVNNLFKQIDFSLKADIRTKNKNELINFKINDPIFNDKLILNSRNNYILNDSDTHEIFRFYKDENIKINNEKENTNKEKFDFILNNKDIYGIESIDESNNHIFEKFNKIVNNTIQNNIFFPWTAEIAENKKKIQGLFLYELNLSGPKLTKDFIREIFYNSTETKIIKQKINNEKTLIIIDLVLNKNGIGSLSDIISHYDIFIDDHPEISWLGLQKYSVINKINKKSDNIFLCKFNFMTKFKGLFEVNRISTKLYKKNEEKNLQEVFMEINHITKPISILID